MDKDCMENEEKKRGEHIYAIRFWSVLSLLLISSKRSKQF